MAYKTTYSLLPRSILSVLHEPVFDPRDGHGARSAHDIMIRVSGRRRRTATMTTDRSHQAHRSRGLREVKAARKQRQFRHIGGGP